MVAGMGSGSAGGGVSGQLGISGALMRASTVIITPAKPRRGAQLNSGTRSSLHRFLGPNPGLFGIERQQYVARAHCGILPIQLFAQSSTQSFSFIGGGLFVVTLDVFRAIGQGTSPPRSLQLHAKGGLIPDGPPVQTEGQVAADTTA